MSDECRRTWVPHNQHIIDNVHHNRPNAKMDGISIEPMIVNPQPPLLAIA